MKDRPVLTSGYIPCPSCNGRGVLPNTPSIGVSTCDHCGGDGRIFDGKQTIVQIPPPRDEIALIAMKIMLTGIYGGQRQISNTIKEKSPGIIPKNAYALADAMIEASIKEPTSGEAT